MAKQVIPIYPHAFVFIHFLHIHQAPISLLSLLFFDILDIVGESVRSVTIYVGVEYVVFIWIGWSHILCCVTLMIL